MMSRTWNRTSPPTPNQIHVVAAQAAESERRGLRAYANHLSTSARRQRTRDRVSDVFPTHRVAECHIDDAKAVIRDLLAPHGLVRDEKGTVVGCSGFSTTAGLGDLVGVCDR